MILGQFLSLSPPGLRQQHYHVGAFIDLQVKLPPGHLYIPPLLENTNRNNIPSIEESALI